MTEYLEREKVYNLLILLAKYETGGKTTGNIGMCRNNKNVASR